MSPVRSKKFLSLLYYQKYLALFLILVGIPIFLFVPSNSTAVIGSEWPLLIGLYTLFFSREKVEDERSANIRSVSLMVAFVLGYIIELTSTFFYNSGYIDWHLSQIRHFVILVLAIATIVFHWTLHIRKG